MTGFSSLSVKNNVADDPLHSKGVIEKR